MDNAAIHTSQEAEIVEELLWETVVDGEALNVIVIYLPTRSPELNPIELIFHILSQRIKSFRYKTGVLDNAVKVRAAEVLDNVSYKDIFKTFRKCGYFRK